MSLHLFGSLVTPFGTAANNRGETDGNVTTLQKLVWHGQTHTTVSAESIRFALRRRLAEHEPVNRGFDEDSRQNTWQDPAFEQWAKEGGEVFVDDDLLGFMSAEAAKDEAVDTDQEEEEPAGGKKAKGKKKKGTTKVRRAVLEVTRAVSLTPWAGDVTFNAASPGATPSAAKKGTNPVPYATEMHATRYQYGFALTPEKLRKRARAQLAIRSLCSLGPVAGNHGRFLYDFSPESVVFRISQDPAPRILYCFEPDGSRVCVPELVRRVQAGDIDPHELVIGGAVADSLRGEAAFAGAALHPGVVAAAEAVCQRLS